MLYISSSAFLSISQLQSFVKNLYIIGWLGLAMVLAGESCYFCI